MFRNTKLVLNLVDDSATYGISVKSVLELFCDSSDPIDGYMFTMMAVWVRATPFLVALFAKQKTKFVGGEARTESIKI